MVAQNEGLKIQKTLQVTSGDTLGVEWYGTFTNGDGTPGESYGLEFWKMHKGRLIEWNFLST